MLRTRTCHGLPLHSPGPDQEIQVPVIGSVQMRTNACHIAVCASETKSVSHEYADGHAVMNWHTITTRRHEKICSQPSAAILITMGVYHGSGGLEITRANHIFKMPRVRAISYRHRLLGEVFLLLSVCSPAYV